MEVTQIILACLVISLIPFVSTRNIPERNDPTQVALLSEEFAEQWQGGCSNNCLQNILYFCEFKTEIRCFQCGMVCNEEDLGEATCKKECPAYHASLQPVLSTEPKQEPTTPSENTLTASLSSETLLYSTTSHINDTSTPKELPDKFDNRWVIGLIVVVVLGFAVCFMIFYLKKRNCITKPQVPTQCTENHDRAPAYYKPTVAEKSQKKCQYQKILPNVVASQQPIPDKISLASSSGQPNRNNGTSSHGEDRVVVSGANDSVLYQPHIL